MKKKKLKKLGIILIIALILLILILTVIIFIFFNPLLQIKLNGKDQTIEVYSKYKELGAKVSGTKNKYKITGKVNTNKLGTYKIIYKVSSLKTTKKITRTIKVVDKTKPVITLTGADIELYQNQDYQEPGYKAEDNYDKDVTDKVKIDNPVDKTKVGEYKIKYTVTDSSKNKTTVERNVTVKEQVIQTSNGITYINGIMIVNKTYSLPSTYNPGEDPTARAALTKLQQAATNAGHNIPLLSGFRSYSRQQTLYNNYVARDGQALADTYSARPGHSEHQSGLAFDIGKLDNNYGETAAGKWLAQNAHNYGFIIRYLKGKESITGFQYEPWHVRYVGVEHATNIYNQGITLEEYLNIT